MNKTCGLAEGLCYGCLDDMNYNLLDECKDCPIYPSCIRPKYCEEMGKCDEYIKDWRIRRHMSGLDMLYNDYKGNKVMPFKLSENV